MPPVKLRAHVIRPLALQRVAVEERVLCRPVPLPGSPAAVVPVACMPGVVTAAAVHRVQHAALAVFYAFPEAALVHRAVGRRAHAAALPQPAAELAFVHGSIGPHQLAAAVQLAVRELPDVRRAAGPWGM